MAVGLINLRYRMRGTFQLASHFSNMPLTIQGSGRCADDAGVLSITRPGAVGDCFRAPNCAGPSHEVCHRHRNALMARLLLTWFGI